MGKVFGRKDPGVALLGGEVVDYRRLYDVPLRTGGAGMRYRAAGTSAGEGYSELQQVEDV